MAALTAYCSSSPVFHPHSLTTTRSQFSSSPRRTTLSPPSSSSFSPTTTATTTTSISQVEQVPLIKTIKSDENNNDHEIENVIISNSDDILYITSDDDDDDDEVENMDDDGRAMNDFDEEEILSLVGLRVKTKKRIVAKIPLRPLTKLLAYPVCLLPLPKYSERVRQALYVRLPSLKFLSSIRDIELFCSTSDNAKAQSLLPRSSTQTRASSTLKKSPKKHKLRKTGKYNLRKDDN